MYKIFISGPMSGYDNFNKEAFIQAEQIIDRYFAVEHEIVNPARFVFPDGFSREDMLVYDIKQLSQCSAIVMLDNWRDSKGATAEYFFARACDITIHEFSKIRSVTNN